MELLYLWIEKYKNIRSQGFNFSSEYDINVKNENNYWDSSKKIEFSINKNQKYNENDFFEGKIINLTAIVGKNGTGKTSLLEFFNRIFMGYKINNQFNGHFFVVVKHENKIKVINYGLEINSDEGSIAYKKIKIDEKNILFNNMNKIYFDNTFNWNYSEVKMGYDLSIVEMLRESFDYVAKNSKNINGIVFSEILRNAKNNSIVEELSALKNDDLSSLLNVEAIQLNVKKNYIEYEKNQNHFISFEKEEITIQKEKIDILIAFLIAGLKRYEKIFKLKRDKEEILGNINKIKSFVEKYKLSEFSKELNNVKEFLIDLIPQKNIKKNRAKYLDEINNIFEFLNLVKDVEEINFNFKKILVNRENFFFKTDEKILKIIVDYFEVEYFKIGKVNSFTEYPSEQILSSGEKALLRYFSMLYFAIKKEIFPNILLLMDEPDIYMHPEWQRQLVLLLTKFINNNFKKNIQIILTSHSPFITSDLPRENIIFLDKYKAGDLEVENGEQVEGNCKVINPESMKKTFAGNIHTLLSDAFFMESTTGEFAKSKLREVMKILDREGEITEKEEQFVKYIINSVGEPILKTKLQKMLEDKISLNLFDVDNKIKNLQKQIDELKALKGEADDKN